MSKNNAAVAEAFYTHMGEKHVDAMEPYLHPDVQFITPMSHLTGKVAYLEATKSFTNMFDSLKIRTVMSTDHQATVIYEVDFPKLDKKVTSASLMTFEDGLIKQVELFYDARPFVQ